MLTTLRAAVAVAMIAGFYLFAGFVLIVLLLLGSWLATFSERLGGKVVIVVLFAAFGLIAALWKVLRTKPRMPDGARVPPEHAPELWAVVRDLAARVGTRTPDEIQLVAEVNAAVVENARWLGLVGGRRYLLIGTPLLLTFSVSQLRSVLAHELGHYSRSHTRLGALTYRGRLTIAHTMQRLDNIVALLMIPYEQLYYLVESAVSRRQELEADRLSVRLAGRAAAASALQELPVLGRAWGFYLKNYVTWGLDSGYAPVGISAAFPWFWHARAAEADEMRRNPVPEQRSRWDSHPPIAERVATIHRLPDSPVPYDGRPAADLVPGLGALLDAVDGHEFHFGARQRVPLAQFTAYAAQADRQDVADRLYRTAGRLSGDPHPGLHTVLGLIESGRHAQLVSGVNDDYPAMVRAALAAALVRADAAHWQLSWTDPVVLIGRDGAAIPLDAYAAPFVHGDAAGVRHAMAALGRLGVSAPAASIVESTATASRAEVLGAMINMMVDGKRRDLVVLDTGLVVVPASGRWKQRGAAQRLINLARLPPDQLAVMPGHRYLPFENVSRVSVWRRLLRRAYTLTMHDGVIVRIRRRFDTGDIGETGALYTVLGTVAERLPHS